MVIGQVIGSTTLRGYRFVIKEGMEPHVKRDEFVSVKESVTGKRILGIVKDIVTSNELLPDEFSRDMRVSEIVLSDGEYPVPVVKVLGIEGESGLDMPRYGIKPGAEVELLDDETLRRILHQDENKSCLVGVLSSRPSIPVYVSINELVSKHCAVLAMTGAGKSYTVGVLVEELMKKRGSVVIFDLHGEYKDISIKDSNVKVYSIEGEDKICLEVSMLSASDFVNLLPDMTTTQRDLLDEILSLSYKFYEKYDLKVMLTILDILYELKTGDKKQEVEKSIFPEKVLRGIAKKIGLPTIGSLSRRIKRLDRMGIFEMNGIPLDEMVCVNQLTIINLSEADERVSEMIVTAISRAIFDARRKFVRGEDGEGLAVPVFMIIEEAHNFAPRASNDHVAPARTILRRIAREGRKFGVGLCVVSQRSGKLDSDVLSQCNTQVIMKIVNPSDQEYIRQSVETVTEDIVRDLPGLSRGEAIIVGSAIQLPVPVMIRRRETAVGGSDIDVVGAWEDG